MSITADSGAPSRALRADARLSVARILEAAQTVLAAESSASLEEIADAAGVSRATLHRHFPSRQALLTALVETLNARYREAFDNARVAAAPPSVALYRLTEAAFELKTAHPFVITLTPSPDSPGAPASDPLIREKLDDLFSRLYEAGDIGVADAAWCRRVYLALLHEAYELPADSPALKDVAGDAGGTDARVRLVISTLRGALGAAPA